MSMSRHQEGSVLMTTPPDTALLLALRGAVRAEIQPLFVEMQRLVDRRIAELGAELHASMELVDMNEARLSRELAVVQERIAGLVAPPSANTRNSGVELEAVVIATETAANTIMEAAEAIQDWIMGDSRDPASIEALASRVSAIFEACSFQDVTGQRIRRAIQHLQSVENMLERFALAPGEPAERLVVATGLHTVAPAARGQSDMGQAEIDVLLKG
jgi:chemotaxis regulatin CheY-phosphate phosphatase CheZ